MTHSSITVFKVGGSLLDWPGLPARLAEFLTERRMRWPAELPALIVGGGSVVDLVRDLDRDHQIGDQVAHALALYALDLTAMLLGAILPGSRLVDRIDALAPAWKAGAVPILDARPILAEIDRDQCDPLPATWETTSDSIAARLAQALRAECLVLLKSASLPAGASLDSAAKLRFVDPILPALARSIPRVSYMNFRDPTSVPIDFVP